MPDLEARSAQLIERLLADGALRARFRADPATVLREYGLEDLAGESPPGAALRTLELRQSRSSLAGAMFAAAAEGVELAGVAARAAPHLAHDAAGLVRELEHHPGHPHPARGHRAADAGLPAESIPPLHEQARSGAGSGSGTTTVGPAPAGSGTTTVGPAPNGSGTTTVGPAPNGSGTTTIGPAPSGAATPPPQPQGAGEGTTVLDPGRPSTASPEHARGGSLSGHGVTVLDPTQAAPHDVLRYPGDDASPRQLALWMGAHAVRAGLPPALHVMAALTESGLRNLPYGDRDSLGFFQMRASIWDQGSYAGYAGRPELQLQWFIDQALAVRAAHAADPAFGKEPASFGEWVAEIEQPAAAYRGRYQGELAAAQSLIGGFDFHAALTAAPSPGELALRVAEHFLGTPYQWGGASP